MYYQNRLVSHSLDGRVSVVKSRKTFSLYSSAMVAFIIYDIFINDLAEVFPALYGSRIVFIMSALFVCYLAAAIVQRWKMIGIDSVVTILLLALVLYIASLDSRTAIYIDDIVNISAFRNVWLLPIAYSVENDPSARLKQLHKVAFFAMIIKCFLVVAGIYASSDYMSFGYGTVIWCCIYIQYLLSEEDVRFRVPKTVVCIGCCLAVVLFGNRGVILVFAAFSLYCLKKFPKRRGTRYFVITAFVLLIMGIFAVLLLDIDDMDSSTLLTKSRTLFLIVDASLSDTSGRNEVWGVCWSAIKRRPLIGYGVGYDRVICRNAYVFGRVAGKLTVYAHNLLLELLIDFGILGTIPILAAIAFVAYKMFTRVETKWMELYAPYFIVSMTQMMISSSIYVNSAFWCAWFIGLAALRRRRKRSRKSVSGADDTIETAMSDCGGEGAEQ